MSENEFDSSQNNTPNGEIETDGAMKKKQRGNRTSAEADAREELRRRKAERAEERKSRRHHSGKIDEKTEENPEEPLDEDSIQAAKKAAMEKRRAELQAKEAKRNQRMMAQFGRSNSGEQNTDNAEKERKNKKSVKPAKNAKSIKNETSEAEQPVRRSKKASIEIADEPKRTRKEVPSLPAEEKVHTETVKPEEAGSGKKKSTDPSERRERRQRTPEEQKRIAEIKRKRALRERRMAEKDGIEGLSPEEVERRRQRRAKKAAERAAARKAEEEAAKSAESVAEEEKQSESEKENSNVLPVVSEGMMGIIEEGLSAEIIEKEAAGKADTAHVEAEDASGNEEEADAEETSEENAGQDTHAVVVPGSVDASEEAEKTAEEDAPEEKEESEDEENSEEKEESEDEENSEEKEESEDEENSETEEKSEDDEESEDEEESENEEESEDDEESEDEEESGKKKKELTPEEKKKRKRFWGKVRRGIGLTVLCLVLIYAAGSYFYMTHFYPNTTLNGCNVSNRSVNGVRHILKSGIKKYTPELIEKDGTSSGVLSSEDLGLYVDWDRSAVSELLLNQSGFDWVTRLFKHQTLTTEKPLVTCEEDTALATLNKLDCVNDTSRIEPTNATVVKDDATKTFIIQDEVPGTVVDPENLMNAILVAANALDETVDMDQLKAYKQADITIDSAELHDRLAEMNSYLDGSITYDVGYGRSEVLDKERFFDWITIDEDMNVYVDEDSVIQYVDEFSEKYDDYGCGKYFTSSYGVTVYIPNSEGGWLTDKTAEVEAIISDIKSGKKVERAANYAISANSHDDGWWGGTYIEVSITHQRVWVYSNYECVFATDVVTGCEANGTETWTGIFSIKNKMSGNVPLVGEDYVSYVTYWMAFNGGEGFHDATWRGSFGGSIYYYSGSHGCVNMYYYDAATMYDLVYVGMPVIVYKDDM